MTVDKEFAEDLKNLRSGRENYVEGGRISCWRYSRSISTFCLQKTYTVIVNFHWREVAETKILGTYCGSFTLGFPFVILSALYTIYRLLFTFLLLLLNLTLNLIPQLSIQRVLVVKMQKHIDRCRNAEKSIRVTVKASEINFGNPRIKESMLTHRLGSKINNRLEFSNQYII